MKKTVNSTPRKSCLFFLRPLCVLLLLALTAKAQVDEAKQAIERGEYVRAVNILSEEVSSQPSPDAYLYLAVAYRHMKEYQRAEDVFNEGIKRYSNDSRFHNELANLFLENNDIDAAKAEFRRALQIDPNNNYASDQLAEIDMSEGEVQSALRAWNKTNRPFISDILHNYYLNFGSWVVRRAVTFHPAGTLRYSEWKTTESRLFATENFSNVGLEIEPTRVPDQYNAVVRTTRKTNALPNILFDAVKGLPVETTYLNLWDIHNSGVNFNANYRWDTNRRRTEGGFNIPLPIAGLLQLEVGQRWRQERWDVSRTISPQFLPEARFLYKSTDLLIGVKQIPQYRVELAAGFEYRNRAAKGDIPGLFLDSLNTGKFSAGANLRLFDRAYQSQLRLEGFGARRSIIGNTQFAGGTAEFNNRVTLSKDSQTNFDWSLKGGTARGALPIEDYFVLGLDAPTTNLLRGHTTAVNGKYGNGPIGSDFVLVNTDIERRVARIPFFNNLNIPYFTVKWEVFVDGAKTWDRRHIFQTSKLLIDTGGGIRLEAPAESFNLVYGKSLSDGRNVFYAYYERRFW